MDTDLVLDDKVDGVKGLLKYGSSPVPVTTLWRREAPYSIARCPVVGKLAICQASRPGEDDDRPNFGTQHFNRQRRAAVLGLCDLCGKPLKGRTKFSLSEPIFPTGNPMQLEPLLHRECAEISLDACPYLKASAASGKLNVRMVTSYRAVPDILPPEIIAEQVPDYRGPMRGIVGYVFIELTQWRLGEGR